MWARLKILIANNRGKDMLDIITPEDVTRGIKMMSSGTAVGIDHWSPYHWTQLIPEAIEAIAHLFNLVEKHGVWPGYIYYNIMGKPAGGSRPIALMPILYGLWTKIRRPQIINWQISHQGPWTQLSRDHRPLELPFWKCSRMKCQCIAGATP